jgi:hypothetical protein
MSAAATLGAPAGRIRRWRFIALALVAIGVAISYRWPFTVEEVVYWEDPNGRPDKGMPPRQYVSTTWRRDWRGGKVLDGPKTYRRYSPKCSGKMTARQVEHYRAGILDGPFLHFRVDGVQTSGQYEQGKKHGPWTTYDPETKRESVVNWKKGSREVAAE